jgi:hypothetical protein
VGDETRGGIVGGGGRGAGGAAPSGTGREQGRRGFPTRDRKLTIHPSRVFMHERGHIPHLSIYDDPTVVDCIMRRHVRG